MFLLYKDENVRVSIDYISSLRNSKLMEFVSELIYLFGTHQTFLLAFLFLPFGMKMFYSMLFCHCTLEACNLSSVLIS